MAKFARVLWCFMLCFGVASSLYARQGDRFNPFVIYQIIPDNISNIERGFENYFSIRGIAVKIIRIQMNKSDKKFDEIIADIKKQKPDLVYTNSLEITRKIFGTLRESLQDPEKYITQIPGVFVNVAYPVDLGLIQSTNASGRNITGVGYLAPMDIQLKSMLDYRNYKKIGIIYNSQDEESLINKNQLITSAHQLGIEVVESKLGLDLGNKPMIDSLNQIIADHVVNNVEILYLGSDNYLRHNIHHYAQIALRANVPIFSASEPPLLESKALLGMVANLNGIGKIAGRQAENILVDKGKPETSKFITSSEFATVLNVKAIKILDDYPTFDQLKRYKIVGFLP